VCFFNKGYPTAQYGVGGAGWEVVNAEFDWMTVMKLLAMSCEAMPWNNNSQHIFRLYENLCCTLKTYIVQSLGHC
jgi:hypothetical protein